MKKTNIQFMRCSLLVTTIALSGLSGAAPSISSLEVESGENIGNRAVLTIHGSGFGNKQQAAPVLFDRQTFANENGALNDFFSTLEHGKLLPTSRDGEERSPWARANSGVFMDRGMRRSDSSDGTYLLEGANSWIGLPVAYGGVDGWDTPTDERYLYVSWRYKVSFNSSYYWRFVPHDVDGDFLEGENLIIDGESRGEFVGIDDDGNVNAVFHGEINNNFLSGKTIQGEDSRASMKFPPDFRIDGAVQYWRPGTKYMRNWDDPDSEGIRTSLSGTDFFVAHHPDRDKGSNRIDDRINVDSSKWHHFEVKFDMKKGTMKSWFNGRLRGVAGFDPEAAFEGKYSPTVALMGNNSPQEKMQKAWISDIYMDNSPKRVILANKAKASELEDYELQMPSKWTNDEIVVTTAFGELSLDDELYLYIYGEGGEVNAEGVPVCELLNCVSAPAAPEIIVE